MTWFSLGIVNCVTKSLAMSLSSDQFPTFGQCLYGNNTFQKGASLRGFWSMCIHFSRPFIDLRGRIFITKSKEYVKTYSPMSMLIPRTSPPAIGYWCFIPPPYKVKVLHSLQNGKYVEARYNLHLPSSLSAIDIGCVPKLRSLRKGKF